MPPRFWAVRKHMFAPGVITSTLSTKFQKIMRSTGHKGGPATTNKREISQHPDNKNDEIKTDRPISEKDEVKQAETRLQKAVKKRS